MPSLYPGWLSSRIRAGFAKVKNPFNPNQIRRVDLRPPPRGDMDCLVLWTRNPGPLLDQVKEWERVGLRTLWLITSTGYPSRLEPNAPSMDLASSAVAQLSNIIGKERISWRYDPIFICRALGLDSSGHGKNFRVLAEKFASSAGRCILSIYDGYAKAERRLFSAGISAANDAKAEALEAAAFISQYCSEIGLSLQSCCEPLEQLGIRLGACIDGALIDKLWGLGVGDKKDAGQRTGCKCAPSVDIGAYNTCTHGCLYCYASNNFQKAAALRQEHDSKSEILN